MKKSVLYIILIVLLATEVSSFTFFSEEAPKTFPPVKRLPDTSYASVEKYISYRIDTLERSVSGNIEDLESQYDPSLGILTFRGNPERNAPFEGRVSGCPSKVVVDWIFNTPYDTVKTSFGRWGGGSGWTGQPLYVHWPDSLVAKFKSMPAGTTDAFCDEEIIVGSLARHVYFIDYKTGKASREPLETTNPVKGTVSLDPSLNGRLYVGQAIPMQDIGALILDLFHHNRFSYFGKDKNAWRPWGAYDSSPIAVGRFIFRPGENGTIYKLERFSSEFTIHSTLRYKDRTGAGGVESSMAVYRNYGYFGDNHGYIVCINLDNLRPVWVHFIGDDTDATPVVQEENGTPMVYAGCEIDKQGNEGNCNFVKLDGLSGEVVWRHHIPCRKCVYSGKTREGGMFSTPYIGKGDCDCLIFTNICFPAENPSAGDFVAMDRFSGKERYRIHFPIYAWSSPVGFLNENNEMFIVTGDINGNIYLIRGNDGKVLFRKRIGDNFESSPAVIDSCLVVGSRGRSIFKMHLE